MRSPVLILLGAPALAALNVRAPVWAPAASCRPAVRMAVATTSADLQTWLAKSAGVSPQFLDKVMATCEEEMIGSVDNLATLQRNGMLSAVFKPVIAASIETALGNGPEPAAPAAASSAPELPLADVKRQLMANQQDTWGTEVALRSRLAMFLAQENLKLGGSWDSISKQWAGSAFAPPTSASVAAPAAPVAAPAAPVPAPSPPPAAAAPAAAPPPAAAAPAVEAPPAASPPPASDKSTFTVTLKTPDGDLNFECPPEEYVLDWAEEQEIEGADDLPYACRAGSCSACAGKIVSGTMDTSGCSFLTAEQKAEGFVLTCTARPTSDVVIETHKEEDLF